MKTERAMTQREHKLLSELVSPITRLLRFLIYCFLVAVACLVARAFNESTLAIVALHWWPVVGLAAAVGLAVLFKKGTGGRELMKALKADISAGKAEDTTLHFVEGVLFTELEDEGRYFFLSEENGTVWMFGGQDLPSKFPRSCVVITIAPVSGYLLGIKATGERVKLLTSTRSILEIPELSDLLTRDDYLRTEFDFESIIRIAEL